MNKMDILFDRNGRQVELEINNYIDKCHDPETSILNLSLY